MVNKSLNINTIMVLIRGLCSNNTLFFKDASNSSSCLFTSPKSVKPNNAPVNFSKTRSCFTYYSLNKPHHILTSYLFVSRYISSNCLSASIENPILVFSRYLYSHSVQDEKINNSGVADGLLDRCCMYRYHLITKGFHRLPLLLNTVADFIC